MRSAALIAARYRAARSAAWVVLVGNALALVGALLHPGANGLPPAGVLAGTLLVSAGLAYFVHRNARGAEPLLVTLSALGIPLLIQEPFVSARTALAILVPAALAALVSSPAIVIAAAVTPVLVMVLRAGGPSPYLDASYLTIYAMIVALIVAGQKTMETAMAHGLKTAGLFDALAKETNEVITIAAPGEDADLAETKYVSPSITRVLGYGLGEPVSLRWADTVHPDDIERVAAMSREIRRVEGTSATGQFRMKHRDGSWRTMVTRGTNLSSHPYVGGVLSTFVDVTELVADREAAELRLEHEARHDAATGLPNRRQLAGELARAIERAKSGAPSSLLFIDIDGFKIVNDSLGHEFGDKLVLQVANRILPALDGDASIFRFGGDELAVLTELPVALATDAAERVVVATRSAFRVDGRDVFVTVSIGLVEVRAEHLRPDDVLREADVAVQRAKERGKNRAEAFDSALRERAERRHDVEQALRGALAKGEFRVVFQPKVSAHDRRPTGFEALLRWTSPTLGVVHPTEFIPLAEETGLIVPIGRWVLDQACERLRGWKRRAPQLAGLKLAVNLSGRQLYGGERFEEDVRAILEARGIAAWDLELEITESVLLTNAEQSVERLQRLKKLGVKLGIDDFGTGYSSLSYLRRFPVDVLKVDRAFVVGLGSSKEDTAIVHLILTLAQALGLETVAEGVETEAQLQELAQLGCDQIQGFHVARPLEADQVETYLDHAFRVSPPSIPPASAILS